jgi:hypothetical protein
MHENEDLLWKVVVASVAVRLGKVAVKLSQGVMPMGGGGGAGGGGGGEGGGGGRGGGEGGGGADGIWNPNKMPGPACTANQLGIKRGNLYFP